MMQPTGTDSTDALDAALRVRLAELHDEGYEIYQRFDTEVRQRQFHPFVPADYGRVLAALLRVRTPGASFLELGSGAGVITIMADLLGFDAYGIEIDERLVDTARALAARFGSAARFAPGSFLPAGYEYRAPDGDHRLGTIGRGRWAYAELGRTLADFDVVYGYPWSGEEPVMLDVMRRYGAPDARLLLCGADGVQLYAGGRLQP